MNNSTYGGEYDKDYVKIKFDSDDDLPLSVVLKFRIQLLLDVFSKKMASIIHNFF